MRVRTFVYSTIALSTVITLLIASAQLFNKPRRSIDLAICPACVYEPPVSRPPKELNELRRLPKSTHSDTPLVFLHIPKTAGTSVFKALRDMLHSSSSADERLLADDCKRFDFFFRPRPVPALQAAEPRSRQLEPAKSSRFDLYDVPNLPEMLNASFLFGHFDASLLTLFPHSMMPRAVTFLRHPLDRFLSSYRFDVSRSRFTGSLQEYINEYQTKHVCNYQTRQLAGAMPGSFLAAQQMPQTDADLLDAAKRNLESFVAFGLTERMTESLQLLGQLVSATQIPQNAPELNVSPTGQLRIGLSTRVPEESSHEFQQARACIMIMSSLDLQLYEFASQLFEQRVSAMLRGN